MRQPLRLLCLALILLSGTACVEHSKVPTQAGSTTPPPAGTTVPASDGSASKTCPPPKADVACTKDYKPVLNSDDKRFGGHGLVDSNVTYFKQNSPYAGRQQSVQIYIPARSVQVLAPK